MCIQVGSLPAPSRAQQLTRYPGQSSQNKLIVFADGTYLELFCWIDTPRESHAWTNRSPVLIDFALTSLPPSTAQSLHNDVVFRLGDSQSSKELGISYTPPEAGSRSGRDGVQVKWESSRPVFPISVNRTDFPFFCHDVTPRTIRVPFDDNHKIKHPCGAVGISTVEVLMPRSSADKFAETYGLILGVPPRMYGELDTYKRSEFEIGLPNQKFGPSTVSLRSEQGEKDRDWRRDRGAGIRGLSLSIVGRDGHGEEALGTEGIASTVYLKW